MQSGNKYEIRVNDVHIANVEFTYVHIKITNNVQLYGLIQQ